MQGATSLCNVTKYGRHFGPKHLSEMKQAMGICELINPLLDYRMCVAEPLHLQHSPPWAIQQASEQPFLRQALCKFDFWDKCF